LWHGRIISARVGKAFEVGYSVLFTTLAYLVTDLATAPHAAALKQRMRRDLAPKVLVIDEVGYTRLKEEQANLHFALVHDATNTAPSF
jgi:DNA replication protein DnaC